MSSIKFDPNTQNKDVGIVLTKVRRVTMATADIELPEFATFLKVKSAGILLWYCEDTKEYNEIELEAGEFILTPVTRLVYQHDFGDGRGTITASAGDIFWGVTAGTIGGQVAKSLQ